MTRNIVTNYWAKPIPIRTHDWVATLDGYEPGDRIGYGPTEAEAIADLNAQLDADEEDRQQAIREGRP